MRRATLNAGDRITEGLQEGGFRYRAAMITPTYRDIDAWSGRHVSTLLRSIRRYLLARGHKLRYVWVSELQARGAVHYHLVVWLPKGVTLPKPDKAGWWPHGSTRIEWARKPVGYLTKYATKGGDGETEFPKGLRLHGRGGLDELQRRVVSWWCLPRYVRDAFPIIGWRVVRAPGGGWLNQDTGGYCEAWRPPEAG
jgi:hypothetical protein